MANQKPTVIGSDGLIRQIQSTDTLIDGAGNIIYSAGNIPNYAKASMDVAISGQYSILPGQGQRLTNTVSSGLCLFVPYVASSNRTMTDIGLEITTSSAATNMRFGLYNDDGTGLNPGTLVEDSGNVSTTTTGFKSFTWSTPHLLTAGTLYWMCVEFSSSAVNWRAQFILGFIGPTTGNAQGIKTISQSYGSLPSNGTGAAWNNTGAIPLLGLKWQ